MKKHRKHESVSFAILILLRNDTTIGAFTIHPTSMWHKTKKFARILAVLVVLSTLVPAQSKTAGAGDSPLCTRDNALEMIKQQIDLTKTFSYSFQRIAVLTRAADLLWPYQQDRARAVLTEAFEIATELEKENAEKGPRSLLLRMQYPDQRYIVIRAIAKRDPRWARDLTQRMLQLGDASPTRDSLSDLLTAERLLESARNLISTDKNTAIELAQASFKYPASFGLTRFLYALAQVDQRSADLFYGMALSAYANKPMREFLYLQAYPFRLSTSLNTPVFAYYQVPPNLVTTELSLYLQRKFVSLIVQRAQQTLEEPSDENDNYRDPSGVVMPPTVSLMQSLMELEPYIKGPLLDLLPAVTQAREKILVSLSVEIQKLLLQPGREISMAPKKNFDEEIESAMKVPDVNRREDLIATAVLSDKSNSQRLEKVVEAIEKVSDSNIRGHVLEQIYFRRATTAINSRQFDEAERLISRVKGNEQRAYLYTELAKTLLINHEREGHASELLDQAISEAKKAGATVFAARTMLTASSLYTKIDFSRSIAVLTDAINCINKIENPDFVRDDQVKENLVPRPGRRGSYRISFYMPGLDPQTAIDQMAKVDFDTALSQSNALTDKLQRALSTLALADVCLQTQKEHKEKPKKI